jgi:hypothetical protein
MDYAIYCDWPCGPLFGEGDLYVYTNRTVRVEVGDSYMNDTELPGHCVLTPLGFGRITEIEVFEIT